MGFKPFITIFGPVMETMPPTLQIRKKNDFELKEIGQSDSSAVN